MNIQIERLLAPTMTWFLKWDKAPGYTLQQWMWHHWWWEHYKLHWLPVQIRAIHRLSIAFYITDFTHNYWSDCRGNKFKWSDTHLTHREHSTRFITDLDSTQASPNLAYAKCYTTVTVMHNRDFRVGFINSVANFLEITATQSQIKPINEKYYFNEKQRKTW